MFASITNQKAANITAKPPNHPAPAPQTPPPAPHRNLERAGKADHASGNGAARGTTAAAALTPVPGHTPPAWASDPTVRRAMATAWNRSNPNAREVPIGQPGSTKAEHGGWVVRNANGTYGVVPWPPGTRDSSAPTSQPKNAVGWYHTHPNMASERYGSGPSHEDQEFTDHCHLPGVAISHGGMYTIPPSPK